MKKLYLKKNVEKVLINVEAIIAMFIITTIESLGNIIYNKILFITIIIFIIIGKVLIKYQRHN